MPKMQIAICKMQKNKCKKMQIVLLVEVIPVQNTETLNILPYSRLYSLDFGRQKNKSRNATDCHIKEKSKP
jgi:hypothetical protein